jgi:hypothetical protein
MSALPELAVAPVIVRLPWLGAAACVQVSVWLASLSLACTREAKSVAEAFCAMFSVVPVAVKVGAVLAATGSEKSMLSSVMQTPRVSPAARMNFTVSIWFHEVPNESTPAP